MYPQHTMFILKSSVLVRTCIFSARDNHFYCDRLVLILHSCLKIGCIFFTELETQRTYSLLINGRAASILTHVLCLVWFQIVQVI